VYSRPFWPNLSRIRSNFSVRRFRTCFFPIACSTP
jgi:hypothetical protein